MFNFFSDNDDRLKQISTLQIEITNDCNLACSICWRALRGHSLSVKNLSFETFKKILDKMTCFFPVREVNVQGLGEPLLCPDVTPILAYAKSKNMATWFVTNGTSLDEPTAKKLVEIGIDKIRFSVDSSDPEVYARIKKGSSLEKVVRNIQELNECKKRSGKSYPVIALNSVVMRQTWKGLGDLVRLAAALGAEDLALIPLVNFSKGLSVEEEQVDFYGEAFRERFLALKKQAREAGVDVNLGISMETRATHFCRYGFYIDVDGGVHPCCNITRFSFGNILRQDPRLVARRYLHFRKRQDTRPLTCKECNKILDRR
jgi:MoaA/NifB/PqqE/SkfB family radical SAM enzyme